MAIFNLPPTGSSPFPQMNHYRHLQQWQNALQNGGFGGRPFSKATVSQYVAYIRKHLDAYGKFNFDSFKEAVLAIPVENFGKRDKFYKAGLCFAKYLIDEGVEDESFVLKARKFRPKRHTPPKQKTVQESAIQKLLDVCSTEMERLIIILLASTGLRASEACSLLIEDVNLETGVITVKNGKWGKSRRVGITSQLVEAVKSYLATRLDAIPAEPLFLNQWDEAMDRHGLRQRLERLGKLVGVDVTAHALRRAFVTINVNKGRPLVHLQIACGHSDIKTTRSYCQTTEQEVIDAMKGWD